MPGALGGRTPLSIAAQEGQSEAIAQLIAAGASVDKANNVYLLLEIDQFLQTEESIHLPFQFRKSFQCFESKEKVSNFKVLFGLEIIVVRD